RSLSAGEGRHARPRDVRAAPLTCVAPPHPEEGSRSECVSKERAAEATPNVWCMVRDASLATLLTMRPACGVRKNLARSAPRPALDCRECIVLPARRLRLDHADPVHVVGPQHAALEGRREDGARPLDQLRQLIGGYLLLGDRQIDLGGSFRILG